MKKDKIFAIVFVFIMLMVTQKLMAVYPLTRTYSISPDSLHQIRAAAGLVDTEPSDALIDRYWKTYTRTSRDDCPDIGDLQRDKSFPNSFNFETQAIKAYTAVLDYDNNSSQYSEYLADIRNYLFTFPWDIYQNALRDTCYYPRFEPIPINVPTEWDAAWWKLTDYQRAREMSYNLILMSYIVDMLYYAYEDTTSAEYTQVHDPENGILTKLQNHMFWIHTTFFNYGLPNSPANGWDNTGWNINDLYADGDPSIIAPLGMCSDSNKSTNGSGTPYGSGIYLPALSNSVSRYHLICGLGYASILTGQDIFLNTFVKNEFKSSTPLPADTPFYGFNDYLTTKSGMFVGGLTYQNRLFYLSNLFLTALKRTKGINLYDSTNDWNCDMIPRMVRYTLRRIDPELHHITFGDDWRYNGIDSNGNPNIAKNHSIQIERGLLSFYYQNTDDPESQDNIRWYVSELKNSVNNTDCDWPREFYQFDFVSSFETVMNYHAPSHGGPTSVTSGGTLPNYIRHGTYSNSEATILRSPTSSYSGYSASHMLVVNHENSFVPYHNNDDNTAFQFYLWGKPVIVEAGYVPYILGEAKYWDWYQSSFSQNLLLINPARPVRAPRIDEAEYLSKPADVVDNFKLKYEDPMNFYSWPISWLTRIQDTRPYFNGSKKQFLINNKKDLSSNGIEHLKIHFRYMNSMSGTFDATPAQIDDNNMELPCNVFRNFYNISNKYFVILDKAIFEAEPDTTIYRNQIHLLADLRTSSGNISNVLRLAFQNSGQSGIYKYIMSGNKNMFIAMGSSIDGVNTYSISDPAITKLAWTPNDWITHGGSRIGSMRRLSITASSLNNQERFITLLYPSENSLTINPVTEAIHDDSGYRVAITEGSRKVFVSLCSDSTLVYPDEDYQFGTDGDFFVVDAESDFSSLNEMILAGGTSITASPNLGDLFPSQNIFASFTSGIDEVIASWYSGDLHVTFKTDQYIAPRYMIKRCGVMPSQFFSKTEYGLEIATIIDTTSSSRGTLSDNINSLAYDANYFYVNYSWEDLEDNGLISDGLVIAKGTVPEAQIYSNISFNGDIVLSGNLTIRNSGSLNILEGSQISINNGVGIYNEGTLTINGGTSRSISIGNNNHTWVGIVNSQNGFLNIKQAIIINASTGVCIQGSATITNSEIKGCNKGIYIQGAIPFVINNNLIKQNTYGIDVSNNFTTGNQGFIEDNQITQNNYGVRCYNSNTYIVSNQISYNTHGGLHLSHYSEPILKNNTICFSENSLSAVPEISLAGDSYPVMDNYYNDINIDGLGYSLYYMPTLSRIQRLDARRNYWGFIDDTLILNSIHPVQWNVIFEPYCLEPNNDFFHEWHNPFHLASQAELNGDIPLAQQLYKDIVLADPQSVEALQSLGRLNSIYAGAPDQFNELHGIYDNYFLSCSDSVYVDLASSKRVMLDRFEGLYLQALGYYEERLTTCSTEIDSLFFLLDIAYTLEEMLYDDQGKSAPIVNYTKHGLQITTITEAKQTIDLLWKRVMSMTHIPNELTVPVPTQLDIKNYPNPFNPSTTISFAVPKQGNVKLSIYNVKGQKIRELLNEHLGRGFHKVVWDGKDMRRSSAASGMYFVVLELDKATQVKKIMLIK